MPQTIVFRRAAWVVAWDEALGSHVYRRDLDLMGKRCPVPTFRSPV